MRSDPNRYAHRLRRLRAMRPSFASLAAGPSFSALLAAGLGLSGPYVTQANARDLRIIDDPPVRITPEQHAAAARWLEKKK